VNRATIERLVWRLEENLPILTHLKHVLREATTDRGRAKEVTRVAGDGVWRNLAAERSTGKKALFVTPRFWPIHVGWELTFAWLAARAGYSPHFLTCGAITPICDAYRRNQHLGLFCARCQRSSSRMFDAAHVPYSTLAKYIDVRRVRRHALMHVATMSLDAILDAELGGAPIGEWIRAPLMRYLRRDLDHNPYTLDAARMFFASALTVHQAALQVLDEGWDMLFMACGKFLHERIFFELARRRGIDVFVYERGYLPDTLLMSVNEFVDIKEDRSWPCGYEPTEDELEKADQYLAARRSGDLGLISTLWPGIKGDAGKIRRELDLPADKPFTVLCSNIIWDTAAVGREVGFRSLFDWICSCIDCFCEKNDETLIIRVHPGEARAPQKTLDRLEDRIAQQYPKLPANVRVVPAESLVSTYKLIELADRVIVYSTTVGLEAARLGKQVLVCGRTNYRGKGFTIDVNSREQLSDILAQPARDLTSEEIDRCRKYAWHFFYNVNVPFPLVHEYKPGFFHYTFDNVEELFAPNHEFATHFTTELARRPTRFVLHRS